MVKNSCYKGLTNFDIIYYYLCYKHLPWYYVFVFLCTLSYLKYNKVEILSVTVSPTE